MWDKVRLYLASGDLPDVFNLMNGPIAEEMISDNKLVNMTEALQAEGKYDEMNQAVRDFFTAKDGNVYMLPSGRVAEFFAYRKPLFEKYGLSVPTTWEEFLQVCETLRDNGEVPYVMSGDSADMYLKISVLSDLVGRRRYVLKRHDQSGDSFCRRCICNVWSRASSETWNR